MAVTAVRIMVDMDATGSPLDGERLFVAQWSSERTFAPFRPTALGAPAPCSPQTARLNEEPMAAVSISICQQPGTGAPARLRTSRPTVRSHPSAAVCRRRAATTTVVLAALGILLGAGSLAGAGQAPSPTSALSRLDTRPVAAATHVVQPGDTFWSLARRIQPDGDVRPLVARLRAAHGPGPLQPGEALLLAV